VACSAQLVFNLTWFQALFLVSEPFYLSAPKPYVL